MKPGDKVSDGTIYAGVSPDTGKEMSTTPVDAPLTMTFNQAADYATKLDAHGHNDWRVPTKAELNVLFSNRAAIGGFNQTASTLGWYTSANQNCDFDVWGQQFTDGRRGFCLNKFLSSSLRCVR